MKFTQRIVENSRKLVLEELSKRSKDIKWRIATNFSGFFEQSDLWIRTLHFIVMFKQLSNYIHELEWENALTYTHCPICNAELHITINPRLSEGEGFFVMKECWECYMNWVPDEEESTRIMKLVPEEHLAQLELMVMEWHKGREGYIEETKAKLKEMEKKVEKQLEEELENKLREIIKRKLKGKTE